MPVATEAAELGGSVGIGPEILAAATSTRHDIDPGVRAWVSTKPGAQRYGALAFTAEIAASHRVDDRGDLYRYASWNLAGTALAEWAVGSHATALRLGAGPALMVRTTRLESGGPDLAATARILPGGRGRLALDGPVFGWEHVGWSAHTGVTIGREGADWDVGFGGGYRW